MTQTDSLAARRAMIDSQLRTSGINAPFVLERMAAVPREDFLPAGQHAAAYIDRTVMLDDGGALAAPVFYGALLSEAAPRLDDTVLVVEGGTGYLAALVAPLVAAVKRVTAAEAASGKLRGSHSLVLVDGAVEDAAALARLLAEDGRIVTGLVERGVTRLASGRKAGAALALLPVGEMGIPRLSDFDRPRVWSF